jgi:hypothetical protein
MHSKSLANVILLVAGTALTVLLVYGLVGIVRIWAQTGSTPLSTTHKVGITVLALVVAVMLIGAVARMVFQGRQFRLTKEQLDAITGPLSIWQPLKELLVVSTAVDYRDFEAQLVAFCKYIDERSEGIAWKGQRFKELVAMVNNRYPRYRNHMILCAARMANCYPWLPPPTDPLLRIIAQTDDLGSLGHILAYCERRKRTLAKVAALRYEQELSRSSLAHRKLVLRIRAPILATAHVASRQVRGRSQEEYLRDYATQIKQAAV